MELPSKKPIFQQNTTPEVSKKTTPPVVKTTASPEILLNKNVKGILPTTMLSEEDREKIAKNKERKYKLGNLLKKIGTTLGMISVLLFFFLEANISETNAFLSRIGIDKNIGLIVVELEEKSIELEMTNLTLESDIQRMEEKIENKYYTLFSEDIKKIKNTQLTWFDIINQDGEISIGVIDGIKRVADYLSDNDYKDPNNIISGRHEEVQINNISANRDSISFSAAKTQILGRIIYMGIEFIDVLNSFPLYKEGKHFTNFSREKDEDGDYSSEFSLILNIQTPEEVDPNDERFSDYVDWFENKNPGTSIKDSPIINQ